MPAGMFARLKGAWNMFTNKDPTEDVPLDYMTFTYSRRPDRPRFTRGNQRSIITPIYNRLAMDVSSLKFNHVQLDTEGRYESNRDSDLNECLTINANVDQTGRALIQDIVMSMLDEGSVAVVPVDTEKDPKTGATKIYTLRTGRILEWRPRSVLVDIYNDRVGRHEQVWVAKESAAIVENPFYSVMNESNSTLSRLKRKLALIDIVDEKNASAKLDIIVQLPYVVKGEMKEQQARKRIESISNQLENSKYGIAYTDGTERITQLNRSVESNLLKHVEYLTNQLYSQLGISEAVMNGTADEKEMLNYNNRTIEPLASAISDEMTRKFLSKTARTQGQVVMFFRDPFRLVPVEQIAEIADKFTRNEIVSSNEMRQAIGMKPSKDPKADELRNANISEPKTEAEPPAVSPAAEGQDQEEEIQNG